jgi:pimeloyl-ACP methyl ester carboxylesterase
MLCLHGRGAHAHWFDFVARGLAADYHIRALDLPGHGDSPWANPPAYTHEQFAQTLSDAAEHLDLRDFILVGHSMGGMISLLYAATSPPRLGKLVVIDSTLRASEESATQSREIASRGRSYATREDFMRRFRLRPEDSAASPQVLRHIASHSARQQPDGTWRIKFDRQVYSSRTPIDGVTQFAAVTVPALLVKGALSNRLTPQLVAEVKTRCPQVQVAEVSASYHHVTLDNPKGFVSELRKFLGS